MVSKGKNSYIQIIYTHYGVIQFGSNWSLQMNIKVLCMAFSLYAIDLCFQDQLIFEGLWTNEGERERERVSEREREKQMFANS